MRTLTKRRREGNTPHNPCRYADTVGIVLERVRPGTAVGTSLRSCHKVLEEPSAHALSTTDRLRWYCQNPQHSTPVIIREKSFRCTDLGTQLKPLINVRIPPSYQPAEPGEPDLIAFIGMDVDSRPAGMSGVWPASRGQVDSTVVSLQDCCFQ